MDSPVTAKYRLCIYMLEEMVFKKKHVVTLPPASYTKRRSVNQNNLPLVIYEVTQTCCD